MATNNPSDIFTEMDLKYINSLDERQKRQYLATRATSLGIAEYWESNLKHIYPNAKELLLLCDGGGSNSARGWLFKWELIQ